LRSDGTAAKAGGKVVKNVAGYDLMRLFCGSWGSLGLISELTLRTMPLPKGRQIVQLKGALEDLQQLRQQLLLHSSMALEFIEWRQGPGAATCLQLGLCNLAQEQQLQLQLTPNIQLEKLPQPTTSTTVEAGQWLLRLGLEPVKIVEFMQDPVAQGWQLQLGAASGLGLAQAAFEGMAPYRVEALRRACERRSGYLTVLQSPNNSKLDAWADVKSKPLIKAVKKQFDPLNQLCRGRLPGVASC
jgi:glycolate oxidase FAD binding subunit